MFDNFTNDELIDYLVSRKIDFFITGLTAAEIEFLDTKKEVLLRMAAARISS